MAVSCMRNASGHNYSNSSFIVELAMRQIPRSTKRISSKVRFRRNIICQEGYIMSSAMTVLGFTFRRSSGEAIIAAGGTDRYCHSEPPLTSGKLCFIINFIGEPHPTLNRAWSGVFVLSFLPVC